MAAFLQWIANRCSLKHRGDKTGCLSLTLLGDQDAGWRDAALASVDQDT